MRHPQHWSTLTRMQQEGYFHYCLGKAIEMLKRSQLCFFTPAGCFALLTVHILSYKVTHSNGVWDTPHAPSLFLGNSMSHCVCVCVWTCIQHCFQISMETCKMSICYFIFFVFGPDWIRAKLTGFPNCDHTENRKSGSIYWLRSGSVKHCWFGDQREA